MNDTNAEPVVVGQYATEFEAVLVKNMLTEAGVPAQVVGAMTAGFRAETPGFVKVLVPSEFEEKALELLIAYTKESSDTDSDMDSDSEADGQQGVD